jgi:hypothetical protein
VAPRSPDIDAFATNLDAADSWLTPFNGFGASNFLAGDPAFRFADYREWIGTRFPPRRFAQLEQKMDWPSLYAIGAFIQGLRQNPGSRPLLQELAAGARLRRHRPRQHRQALRRQHRAAPCAAAVDRF